MSHKQSMREVERELRDDARLNMETTAYVWAKQFGLERQVGEAIRRKELRHDIAWNFSLVLDGVTAYPDEPQESAGIILRFYAQAHDRAAFVQWRMVDDVGCLVGDFYQQTVSWDERSPIECVHRHGRLVQTITMD